MLVPSYLCCSVEYTLCQSLAGFLVGLGLGLWGSLHPSPSLPLLTLAPLLRTLHQVIYPLPTALGQGGWTLLLKGHLLMDDIDRGWSSRGTSGAVLDRGGGVGEGGRSVGGVWEGAVEPSSFSEGW